MEKGSIEKKMKTDNSMFIFHLLNNAIDYILWTDRDRLKVIGFTMMITMS